MAEHFSVLLKESINGLNINSAGIYIDGTFGRGGHSDQILKRLDDKGKLLVFDKDPDAIKIATEKYGSDHRVIIHHGSFCDMKKVLEKENLLGSINGVLLDLGVSSPQLDQAERGFSFLKDGPLDMRMNPGDGLSARDVLLEKDEKELADIFYLYGEERYARLIARKIKQAILDDISFTRTCQLSDLISHVVPKQKKQEKQKHPATRVFQALRIFVNNELKDLENLLKDMESILSDKGRLSIISFHSLEDRIVKQFLQSKITPNQTNVPRGLPVETFKPGFKWISKKVKPSLEELDENIRSRSAILRVAERVCDI
ncbi:16S rRNA (cytosine(1402)-N(4))-methyltransferase RsmH [Thiotrichales bacterium 19S9-12]|nr:16S rRNA (cytosine(1402)-N(4))-methyltransferase RsmH [Thiotrichales bacterium 19S9-11]MCF6811868.1 16S rRNA (cytosine(1402)-N(4))-methyltransferase RsmH [Thiotrichales bacterium 19S9-12]